MHCSAPTVFLVFLAQPTSLRNSKRSSCLGQTSENKNSAHVCQTASGIARKCSGLQVTHDNRVLSIIDALWGWWCGFCPTLNFHWRHNLTNNIIRPICDRTNSGYEARTEVPSTLRRTVFRTDRLWWKLDSIDFLWLERLLRTNAVRRSSVRVTFV